jgi:hypothetical protein
VLAVVLVIVWLISFPAGRFERWAVSLPTGHRRPSAAAIAAAAVLALIPLLTIIVRRLDIALAVAGAVLLAASVALDRGRRVRS